MRPTVSFVDRPLVYIDGRWQDTTEAGHREILNPSTGEAIGRAALASETDIDRAVAAARSAFDDGEWRDWSLQDRVALIHRTADILEARRGEIVDLATTELGCPRRYAETVQLPVPFRQLRDPAHIAETYLWEQERTIGNAHSLVIRHPVGVVGAVTPWNGPLTNPTLKVAPAIVAGCTIVLKAADLTPLTGYMLVEALEEAGLPPGVVNYLPGDVAAGRHLVAHPDVDKVAFTGSTAAGRDILRSCAARVARVTMELGGKSAAVMLDDCDVDLFVRGVLPMGMTLNNGQTCGAQTRLIVPHSKYAATVEALTEAVRSIVVGDPFDPSTELGPLVSERQRERVEGYIASGVSDGATIAVGGARPAGFDRGWYLEPTLFVDVDNRMRIAQEEIFGPVVVVIACTDDDDAVRIANDSIYGLSGSVWTADEARGMAVARRLRTGSVFVNGSPQASTAPFGGFKQSGVGREFGPEGLDQYTELQRVSHTAPS